MSACQLRSAFNFLITSISACHLVELQVSIEAYQPLLLSEAMAAHQKIAVKHFSYIPNISMRRANSETKQNNLGVRKATIMCSSTLLCRRSFVYFKSGNGSTVFTFDIEEYPVIYVSCYVGFHHNN